MLCEDIQSRKPVPYHADCTGLPRGNMNQTIQTGSKSAMKNPDHGVGIDYRSEQGWKNQQVPTYPPALRSF